MKNNLFIIIQARTTSTRLPKKVMLPLCGKTVLEVVIDRLAKYKENIIIATTNNGSEDEIINLCKRLKIRYYQGSTQNVLQRYYESAKKYNANPEDIIVRVTSDCPLIDCGILDKTVNMYRNGKYDYVSNRINRTVPIGLDVEVFNFKLLETSNNMANMDYEKEHVTPYIYITRKDTYKIGSYEEDKDNSKYRLTLDEEDDYLAIKEVYRKFNNRIDFNYNELIYMLKSNPYIYEINHNVTQKQVVN